MKLMHVTTVHPENDSRIYHKELKSLSSIYDCALISQRKTDTIFHDIDYFPLRKPKNRFDRLMLQKDAYRIIKQYAPKIVHMHDPELILLALILKLQGKTIIWDMHEDLSRQVMAKKWIPVYLRQIVSKIVSSTERIILPFFDALITVSPIFTKKYSWHKRVTEVRNLAKIEEFDLSDRNHFDIKDINSPIVLVYVGSISEERGLKEMLSVTKKLHKSHKVLLKIAGPSLTNIQRQMIENTEGAEYVGWLDRRQLADLLYSSDIGLLVLYPTPNHQSTLAIKMFEYMAAGIPQITSNFPLWKDIIDETQSGITVNPKSIQDIESAILTLINNRNNSYNMGARGRDAVVKKYNWQKESEKLTSLYRELDKL